MKTGLAMHCHHDTLFEHCYDYDKRVRAIKRDKPQSEQEIRLRLFKLLPQEAIDELPSKLVQAGAEWQKAGAEWQKVSAEWRKAYQETWHKKWCGCKEWDGKEIVFT